MYSLHLTACDVRTLRFVASRGYAQAVYAAYLSLDVTHTEPHEAGCDGACDGECDADVVLSIPEHLAWAIADEEHENGGHGFGPVSAELTAKLYAFVGEIV